MSNQKNISEHAGSGALFYPVRDSIVKILKTQERPANFSLIFTRLAGWVPDKSGKPVKPTDGEGTVTYLAGEYSGRSFEKASKSLEKVQKRQEQYITSLRSLGMTAVTVHAETTSPFITGLGAGHPHETGMILDRNTGVPYIPAGSVKGVLRLSCAVNIAQKERCPEIPLTNPELVDLFGSEDQKNAFRGRLVVLDAFPGSITGLHTDIMNPHFGNYYQQKDKNRPDAKQGEIQPYETEQPVPVKFLTVPVRTCFTFRCYVLPSKTEKASEYDETLIRNIYHTAFEIVGFGSKTAAGYGRFKEVNSDTLEARKTAAVNEQKRRSLPEVNTDIECILAVKNVKGTWKVKQNPEDTDTFGTILNSEKVPADRKAGDKVKVHVAARLETGINARYLPE